MSVAPVPEVREESFAPGGGVMPPASPDESAGLAAVTRAWLAGFASPATRRAYAADLGLRVETMLPPVAGQPRPAVAVPLRGGLAWLPWLQATGRHPLTVVAAEVREWLAELAAADYAVATRARMLAAVRSWYAALVEADLVPASPAARVSASSAGLHLPRTSPTVALSAAHTAALIAAADTQTGPAAARHAAVVALLFTTGLRVGELCGLTIADLSERAGHRVLRVRGKGGHTRRLTLPPLAETRLQHYLERRSDADALTILHGPRAQRVAVPLFATRTGRPLTAYAVFRLLRRCSSDAGLPPRITTRVTPHVARHTTAELARQAGRDLDEIRQLLGHVSLVVTQRYLHGTGEHAGADVAALLVPHLPAE